MKAIHSKEEEKHTIQNPNAVFNRNDPKEN